MPWDRKTKKYRNRRYKKYRKFGGKRYKHIATLQTKRSAKEYQKRYKRSWKGVRLVGGTRKGPGYLSTPYRMYVRGRRR